MAKYTRTDCPLYGGEYCKKLNMKSCRTCTVTNDNAAGIKADIDAIESLMPEGGMARFFEGEECVLCKGERKNRADCYAMADIGHPEPKREGRNAIGLKTKLRIGSMLPVQLSCCSNCRKKHNAASNREAAVTLTVAIIMLAVLNFTPTAEAIAAIGSYMPLLLFVIVVGGTWLIGRASRKNMIKKFSETTCMDIFEVPGLDEFKAKGWFEISPYKDMRGWYSPGSPSGRACSPHRRKKGRKSKIYSVFRKKIIKKRLTASRLCCRIRMLYFMGRVCIQGSSAQKRQLIYREKFLFKGLQRIFLI